MPRRYKYFPGDISPFRLVFKARRGPRVVCECHCGKLFDILAGEFAAQKSCGCLRPKVHIWANQTRIPGTYIKNLVHNARIRGIPFEVTSEYLEAVFVQQQGRCALTGVPISFATKGKRFNYALQTASVDRINSALGYIDGNIQWVYKAINRMKMDECEGSLAARCLAVWNQLGLRLVKSSLPPEAEDLAPDIHKAIQAVVPGFMTGKQA